VVALTVHETRLLRHPGGRAAVTAQARAAGVIPCHRTGRAAATSPALAGKVWAGSWRKPRARVLRGAERASGVEVGAHRRGHTQKEIAAARHQHQDRGTYKARSLEKLGLHSRGPGALRRSAAATDTCNADHGRYNPNSLPRNPSW